MRDRNLLGRVFWGSLEEEGETFYNFCKSVTGELVPLTAIWVSAVEWGI